MGPAPERPVGKIIDRPGLTGASGSGAGPSAARPGAAVPRPRGVEGAETVLALAPGAPEPGTEERAILAAIDRQPEGLGDTLKALLEQLGAERAARLYAWITGRSCGCEARRRWLNRWWPYQT